MPDDSEKACPRCGDYGTVISRPVGVNRRKTCCSDCAMELRAVGTARSGIQARADEPPHTPPWIGQEGE